MHRIGYYPGCSAYGTSLDFDISLRSLFSRMNIELVEIPDWNCCGATPGHVIYEELGVSLSYFNLAKAYSAGLKEILVTCPSCYSNLMKAKSVYEKNESLRKKYSMMFGKIEPEEMKVYHLNDFLTKVLGKELIEKFVVKDMSSVKVAPYYGCLPRLPYIYIDNRENPTLMDDILSWIGVEVVEWPYKVICCGASISVPKPEVATELARKILAMAREYSTDVICVVCPLCQFNLDSREKKLGFNIPVLYLTQIMGMAFGISPKDLALDKMFTKPKELISRVY